MEQGYSLYALLLLSHLTLCSQLPWRTQHGSGVEIHKTPKLSGVNSFAWAMDMDNHMLKIDYGGNTIFVLPETQFFLTINGRKSICREYPNTNFTSYIHSEQLYANLGTMLFKNLDNREYYVWGGEERYSAVFALYDTQQGTFRGAYHSVVGGGFRLVYLQEVHTSLSDLPKDFFVPPPACSRAEQQVGAQSDPFLLINDPTTELAARVTPLLEDQLPYVGESYNKLYLRSGFSVGTATIFPRHTLGFSAIFNYNQRTRHQQQPHQQQTTGTAVFWRGYTPPSNTEYEGHTTSVYNMVLSVASAYGDTVAQWWGQQGSVSAWKPQDQLPWQYCSSGGGGGNTASWSYPTFQYAATVRLYTNVELSFFIGALPAITPTTSPAASGPHSTLAQEQQWKFLFAEQQSDDGLYTPYAIYQPDLYELQTDLNAHQHDTANQQQHDNEEQQPLKEEAEIEKEDRKRGAMIEFLFDNTVQVHEHQEHSFFTELNNIASVCLKGDIKCPVVRTLMNRKCEQECNNHTNCNEHHLCCNNGCAFVCQKAVPTGPIIPPWSVGATGGYNRRQFQHYTPPTLDPPPSNGKRPVGDFEEERRKEDAMGVINKLLKRFGGKKGTGATESGEPQRNQQTQHVKDEL